MHKYTRTRLNTIDSNFFEQLIGYVQRRTNCPFAPTSLKILKILEFFGGYKAIFEQNFLQSNFFYRSPLF